MSHLPLVDLFWGSHYDLVNLHGCALVHLRDSRTVLCTLYSGASFSFYWTFFVVFCHVVISLCFFHLFITMIKIYVNEVLGLLFRLKSSFSSCKCFTEDLQLHSMLFKKSGRRPH